MRVITDLTEARDFISRLHAGHDAPLNPKVAAGIERVFGEPLSLSEAVARILNDVRTQGDAALFEYLRRIDGLSPYRLEVPQSDLQSALDQMPPEVADSLRFAARRIEDYQRELARHTIRDFTSKGLGQRVTALDRVGLYVPGGTAVYPSTVLMTAIPARVAGVREIVLVTPPRPDGSIAPVVLAAAAIASVDRVFAIGGAQAIAALAYGTESIPAVDKIFGPGNVFVQTAKRMVFGTVGVDTIQGPTEAVTVADDHISPTWCAADILAQAEHDPDSVSILITDSSAFAERVESELTELRQRSQRLDILTQSMDANGAIIVTESIEQAIDLSNLYAPEHLCLMVRDADRYVGLVKNAGALFLGDHSPHVLGDYVAGPSHALPTAGAARYSSALGVNDFLKSMSIISLSEEEAAPLLAHGIEIARQEGFESHARSLEVRTAQHSVSSAGD